MEDDKVVIRLKKQPLESEKREMRQRRRKRFLVFLLCLLCAGAGCYGGYYLASRTKSYYYVDKHSKFDKIMNILTTGWLYKNDYDDLEKTLEDNAYYGMTERLGDPYTSYMSSEELQSFSDSINLNFVGIGVTYTAVGGQAFVVKVYDGSPAEKAGILPGDIIIQVDDHVIDESTIDNIKSFVQGEKGTPVSLTVLRQGEKLPVTAVRGVVDSSVYAYAQNDYVYLEISSFGDGTAGKITEHLDNWQDYHKIIIDVRENGGGYQTALEEIAGLFIGNDKVYLRQEMADGTALTDYTRCKKTYTNFTDYVILTDENTASAAEAFTICLKEQLPNVTLVGETTFGKGVVQTTAMIEGDSALKYTTSKWLSPEGNWIQGEGIKPDVEVKRHELMYQRYAAMSEDESAKTDSVSGFTRIAQMCLDYLDYDVDRTDGYMSEKTLEVLNAYRRDNGMKAVDVLDMDTYNALISKVTFEENTNPQKDLQLLKAIEIIEG